MSLLQEAFRDITTAVDFVALSLCYRKFTTDSQSVARKIVLHTATDISFQHHSSYCRGILHFLSHLKRDNRIPIHPNSAISSYNTPINQVKMRNYYGEN